jgi:hypothetical protein
MTETEARAKCDQFGKALTGAAIAVRNGAEMPAITVEEIFMEEPNSN